MAEPNTANIALIVPNTGDLVGAWGTSALNPNFQALDGLFGGVVSLSLAAATTITLTTPAGSITPGGGPNQSQNALISLSGTLTGNAILKVTMPGLYRAFNNCAVATSYVQISPASGTGKSIGLPDGEMCQFFFNGTDVIWLAPKHVGEYLDLCVATSPAWFNAFSVAPYLLCNGATYSTSTFPALSNRLGTTFGGNGINTFGVPDSQNRYRIPLDLGGNLRVTSGVAGVDGTVWGATGGDQRAPQHTHANSLTDPGHVHPFLGQYTAAQGGDITTICLSSHNGGFTNTNNATTGITITNVAAGSGASQNIPPGIVAGLTFIKT